LLITLVACSGPVVERGDSVLLTYTGRYQNGTVFDTNDPALASEIPGAPAEKFTSFAVVMGSGQTIPGFENAILGMQQGETKSVLINARDAYGTYDPEKTLAVPKRLMLPTTDSVDRVLVVSRETFTKDRGEPQMDQELTDSNFRYRITGFNDTTVTLYAVEMISDRLVNTEMGWNVTLNRTTDDAFIFRPDIEVGDDVYTARGPYDVAAVGEQIELVTLLRAGEDIRTQSGSARITESSKDTLLLDFNHPLAGRSLNFTITVNDVTKR
jgi:FKBP-type peptidyl-prolyl cis-trans isomerase 2